MSLLSVAAFLWAGGLAAEVAWSGLDQGSWRIFRSGSPGRPLALPEFPPGSDFGAPALAADGDRIAVEVVGQGIAVCSLASGACRRLPDVAGVAARPAWHPTTGGLLFAVYRFDAAGEDSDVWVADPDLRSARPLVVQTGSQDDPEVSPDGRRLVYTSSQTVQLRQAAMRVVRQLWIMDLVTGEPRPLSSGAFQDQHPAWSPDGDRIAFASDRSGRFEIWVMSLPGGELRQVTAGPGPKTWPAWSPDGRTLIFTWLRDGRYELVKVAASATRSEDFGPLEPGAGSPRRDASWR